MANEHIIEGFEVLRQEFPFYCTYNGGAILTGSMSDVTDDSGYTAQMDTGEPQTVIISFLATDFPTLPLRNKLINEVSGSSFAIKSVKKSPGSPIMDIVARYK